MSENGAKLGASDAVVSSESSVKSGEKADVAGGSKAKEDESGS